MLDIIQKIIFSFIVLLIAYFCFLFGYTVFHDANKFTNFFDYSFCYILGAVSIIFGFLILVFVTLSAVSPKYSSKISNLVTKSSRG